MYRVLIDLKIKKELEKTVFWLKEHQLQIKASRILDEIATIKKHPKIDFLFLSKYTPEQKQEMMAQRGLMFIEENEHDDAFATQRTRRNSCENE